MTRATKMSALVAMGLLMAAATAAAQNAPATTSGGQITIRTLGTGTVGSSKFTEYREVPTGVSIPFVNLFSTGDAVDFNLYGYNVQQTDQRYVGSVKALGMGIKFDYNQIPHDMGNGGRSIFAESSPGVWTMPATLRQSLQTAVASQASAGRTYNFYSTLLAPTFASTNNVDVSGVRKTSNVALNLGTHLPFDVTLSYRNDFKEGYRGLGGGNVRGAVNPSYEVAVPLDEMTHDIGLRTARSFKSGNVYATFNWNLYVNQAGPLMIDNPFQAYDAPVLSGLGGPAADRFSNAPDNEASTGTAGFLLKFKRQTRVSGSLALSSRTQDAQFYPYTANSAVLTTAGVPAFSLAALPQQSYGGKVNTTMYNLSFSSRPIEGLDIRAQYRVYDLTDKSDKWVITGDMSVPHRNWNTVTPTADSPFGRATANVYDTKSSRFTASATYDIRALTLEGQVRSGTLERTSREATTGKESGMALTALFKASTWLGVRGTYDLGKRTAEGHTVYGFQADEAAFENTRTGINIELTPASGVELSLAYFRRDVQYTDRPDRVQTSGGVPVVGAAPIPNTPSGLLEAKYDSYTGEVSYSPTARIALGAYYTYEKDATDNRWSTTSGANLNNRLQYAASNETGTFGANMVFQLVPDKHTFTVNAVRQKVDGLLDITAREAGSFYTPGRKGLIPAGQGGAADITDWDDTEMTTVSARLDVAMMKGWTLSTGYQFEKYDFKDAMNSSSLLMPAHVYIFLKPNDGAYENAVAFAQLSFKF